VQAALFEKFDYNSFDSADSNDFSDYSDFNDREEHKTELVMNVVKKPTHDLNWICRTTQTGNDPSIPTLRVGIGKMILGLFLPSLIK
jgi:hypothetical protein